MQRISSDILLAPQRAEEMQQKIQKNNEKEKEGKAFEKSRGPRGNQTVAAVGMVMLKLKYGTNCSDALRPRPNPKHSTRKQINRTPRHSPLSNNRQTHDVQLFNKHQEPQSRHPKLCGSEWGSYKSRQLWCFARVHLISPRKWGACGSNQGNVWGRESRWVGEWRANRDWEQLNAWQAARHLFIWGQRCCPRGSAAVLCCDKSSTH